MKHLSQLIFIFLLTFSFACGGGKTDKTEETAKKDTNEVKEEKETPKTEETEKPKEETTGKQQVTIGTFVGIEEGDYAHFNFKTEAGEEKSLFVINPDEVYIKLATSPERFKGTKIKVTWEAKKQNIPESGGEMDIEAYIKAEILK